MSATISYTYETSPSGLGFIVRSTDNAHIPCDLANRDYQIFLEAIAGGMAAPEGWTGPRNA